MASIRFPESPNSYLTFPNIVLPNSDWCVSFRESTTDNAGTSFQYLLSCGPLASANAIYMYATESSHATVANRNRWHFRMRTSSGVHVLNNNVGEGMSLEQIVGDGIPRTWVFQRVGNNFFGYSCIAGEEPVLQMNSNNPASGWTSFSPSDHNMGRRQDGSATRAYGGDIAEYFQGDFSLSLAEIELLGAGSTILEIGESPNFYRKLAANVANPPDEVGGGSGTRVGTLATGIVFPTAGGSASLTMESGSFSVSGQPAGILVNRSLPADQGLYAVTGNPIDLISGKALGMMPGAYSVSGQDAEISVARTLDFLQGNYAITGIDLSFQTDNSLLLDVGSYSMSGQGIEFARELTLSLGQGSYAVAGQDAVLTKTSGYVLELASGAYSLAGQALGYLSDKIIKLSQGVYTITGMAVSLDYSAAVDIDLSGALDFLASISFGSVDCNAAIGGNIDMLSWVYVSSIDTETPISNSSQDFEASIDNSSVDLEAAIKRGF